MWNLCLAYFVLLYVNQRICQIVQLLLHQLTMERTTTTVKHYRNTYQDTPVSLIRFAYFLFYDITGLVVRAFGEGTVGGRHKNPLGLRCRSRNVSLRLICVGLKVKSERI